MDKLTLVFVDEDGKPSGRRMADQYREHLRAAGITRPVLFEHTKSRQRVRLHDTRATFVTVSLDCGKGEAWRRGDLARDYPDHVRVKKSVGHDISRLENYVYPIVGDIRIDAFTLDHARIVMRGITEGRAVATRRQVAQLLHRICKMAVFPLQLIATNPLPSGFLPKIGPGKAKGWVIRPIIEPVSRGQLVRRHRRACTPFLVVVASSWVHDAFGVDNRGIRNS